MIVAFTAPRGLTCSACVVRRHGSLTVRREHGQAVACDYRGEALTVGATGTHAEERIVGIDASQVRTTQHCINCGEVLEKTRSRSGRIYQCALAALSHHRGASRRTARLREPLGVRNRPLERWPATDRTSNRTST